jgi:hypothetical protein
MIAHCKPATVEGVVIERAKLDGMRQHEVSRTLVKSPPELWAECSDAGSLARHLGQFGEIRITRLEPETAVAWEGELASGTVRLEPSGWGTKVILTAQAVEVEAVVVAPEPEAAAVDEPVAEPEAAAEAEAVAVAPEPVAEPEPVAVAPEPVAEPEPVAVAPEPVAEPEPVAVAPEPESPPEPELSAALAPRRRGLMAWLKSWFEPPEPVATPLDPVAGTAPETSLEPVPETSLEPSPETSLEPASEPVVEPPAEPVAAEPDPVPEPEAMAEPEPPPVPEPMAEPDPEPDAQALDATAALTAALDSLGQAHHRPFSRA